MWSLGMQEAQYIALVVLIITVPLLVARARFMKKVVTADEDIPERVRGTRAERRRKDR